MQYGKRVIYCVVLTLVSILCLHGSTCAEVCFDLDGGRVRGNGTNGEVDIVIDMAPPQTESMLPLFKVEDSSMNEKTMLVALDGLIYQEMDKLAWQTSYEVNEDERVYDYFETNGQAGSYLAELAVRCLPYRDTGNPKVRQAEQILLKALDALNLQIQQPFYFAGRWDDVIRQLYTDEYASKILKNTVNLGEVMGESVTSDLATYIVARLALGEYTIETNGWIYNPKNDQENASDRGGFIAAAVDDQGRIIHIRFYNPIESVEMKKERVNCVSWETALYTACEWLFNHKPSNCIRQKNTIRQMEICYVIGKDGNAYPVWRIAIEDIRQEQIPNTEKIIEHAWMQVLCCDVESGDVLSKK